MKKLLILLLLTSTLQVAKAQTVGIGTNTPNSKAILDLSSTNQVFLPPRMNDAQMNAITSPPVGSIVYNTDNQQFMGYVKSHSIPSLFGPSILVNKWLPINTGPKTLAWGIIDSFGNKVNSSDNFNIVWDGTSGPSTSSSNNWYKLTLIGTNYYKDSMILLVTAIGNSSWDQAVSTSEIIESSVRSASIKFTDVSRMVIGWETSSARRRSWFSFVLYDLRRGSN